MRVAAPLADASCAIVFPLASVVVIIVALAAAVPSWAIVSPFGSTVVSLYKKYELIRLRYSDYRCQPTCEDRLNIANLIAIQGIFVDVRQP